MGGVSLRGVDSSGHLCQTALPINEPAGICLEVLQLRIYFLRLANCSFIPDPRALRLATI